jgi:hypothetical protein
MRVVMATFLAPVRFLKTLIRAYHEDDRARHLLLPPPAVVRRRVVRTQGLESSRGGMLDVVHLRWKRARR